MQKGMWNIFTDNEYKITLLMPFYSYYVQVFFFFIFYILQALDEVVFKQSLFY